MSVAKSIGSALLCILAIFPQLTHGFNGPNLISPANNSTVSTTTLAWEKPTGALYASNPYRVQVDNNSDFSSPEKDTYTSNTTYTPTLTEATWYWRLYFRDESGTKSDWSSTSSFTYSLLSPSASPTPTSSSTSSPTPIPTTNPSSAPSPTPSPSPENFILSGIPSTLDSTQGFVLNITLNNLSLNQTYYLKGAFKKSDSTNYFGQTKVNDTWIKNSSTYSSQYRLDLQNSTSWTGQLSLMPDPADSGYTGSGAYLFKLARYDNAGNNLTWSAEYSLQLNGSPTTNTTQSSPSPSPTPSPSIKPTPQISPSPIIFDATPKDVQIASIAGISTETSPSPTPELNTSNSTTNPFFNPTIWYFLGGSTFLVSASMIGHRAYKIRHL